MPAAGEGVSTVIDPVATLQVSGLRALAVGWPGTAGAGFIITVVGFEVQPAAFL